MTDTEGTLVDKNRLDRSTLFTTIISDFARNQPDIEIIKHFSAQINEPDGLMTLTSILDAQVRPICEDISDNDFQKVRNLVYQAVMLGMSITGAAEPLRVLKNWTPPSQQH